MSFVLTRFISKLSKFRVGEGEGSNCPREIFDQWGVEIFDTVSYRKRFMIVSSARCPVPRSWCVRITWHWTPYGAVRPRENSCVSKSYNSPRNWTTSDRGTGKINPKFFFPSQKISCDRGQLSLVSRTGGKYSIPTRKNTRVCFDDTKNSHSIHSIRLFTYACRTLQSNLSFDSLSSRPH